MNQMKSIRSQTLKNRFVVDMEFFLPIDKAFYESMKEECSEIYKHESFAEYKTITFKFIENKNAYVIKCINEILKGATYAMIHLDSDNEFVKFVAEMFIRYIDTELEF